jgi:anaphase-promoting complex subunit 10
MDVNISENLDGIENDLREVGGDAIWSLSTAKPGNGIEQLRDENLDTYWQSDGSQPHLINVQFLRKATVSKVALYLDYTGDESYTPKRVAIRSGTSQHDLVDIATIDLHEPLGWVTIVLTDGNQKSLRTHLLQIRVMSMHQNGRDTHIRHVKLFGPRLSFPVMGGVPLDRFQSVEMQQYAVLR